MKSVNINELRAVEGSISIVCNGCGQSWAKKRKLDAYAMYCMHRFERKMWNGKKNPCFFKTPSYWYC